MQYKDLKEMTFKDWDGKPFRAIVIDNDNQTLFASDKMRYDGEMEGVLVTGYNCERWCTDDCVPFEHAYPLECNKKPKKRMTNRQLAMWLTKGNGERSSDKLANSYHHHAYLKSEANDFVDECILVRKWDSEEWVEPTVDLLED